MDKTEFHASQNIHTCSSWYGTPALAVLLIPPDTKWQLPCVPEQCSKTWQTLPSPGLQIATAPVSYRQADQQIPPQEHEKVSISTRGINFTSVLHRHYSLEVCS